MINFCCTQGRPEKLRGPRQRVKVGPQGQRGFHSESQAVSQRPKKRSLHADNDNSYPSLTMSLISLLRCSSEEYRDCSIRVSRSDYSIRVYRSVQGALGPFQAGARGKMPQLLPLWAALAAHA